MFAGPFLQVLSCIFLHVAFTMTDSARGMHVQGKPVFFPPCLSLLFCLEKPALLIHPDNHFSAARHKQTWPHFDFHSRHFSSAALSQSAGRAEEDLSQQRPSVPLPGPAPLRERKDNQEMRVMSLAETPKSPLKARPPCQRQQGMLKWAQQPDIYTDSEPQCYSA